MNRDILRPSIVGRLRCCSPACIGSIIKGTCRTGRRFQRMPYFYFDLVVDGELRNQGGMILEDLATASDKADQLASELYIVKPGLRSRGCAIRVTDGDGNEVYLTPIDPLPTISGRT